MLSLLQRAATEESNYTFARKRIFENQALEDWFRQVKGKCMKFSATARINADIENLSLNSSMVDVTIRSDKDRLGVDIMIDQDIRRWIATALFSILVPLGVYVGRMNVRASRREIVRDLERLFQFAKVDGRPLILPSFELVKYKYDPESNPDRRNIDLDSNALRYYLFPVTMYVILTFLLFNFSFIPRKFDDNNLPVNWFNLPGEGIEGVITYTFISGYIWSVQYLIRRVANFDLSPISFFQAFHHIALSLFVTSAIYQSGALSDLVGHKIQIALAFVIGFYPDLCISILVAKFPWIRLRRVSSASRALQEELPLDMILGIDPFMKLRLGEFEIEDVQNLATINPIQIFVETPYGLYEVIDWVAQAQLILAVGASRTYRLRELNIRTIFDLERCIKNLTIRHRLIEILLGTEHDHEIDCPDQVKQDTAKGSEVVLNEIRELETVISCIRDDLHVRRLRQIWDVINGGLDERYVRLNRGATVEPDTSYQRHNGRDHQDDFAPN